MKDAKLCKQIINPVFNRLANKAPTSLTKRKLLPITLLLNGLVISQTADAHISYLDLNAAPVAAVGGCAGYTTGCQNVAGGLAWGSANQASLADSHNFKFLKFHLDDTANVNIRYLSAGRTPTAANPSVLGLDPAFSVYRGVLPNLAHDDTPMDPLFSGSFTSSLAIPDTNPLDPLVPKFIPRNPLQPLDNTKASVDPNNPGAMIANPNYNPAILNPAWNENLAAQYADLYSPHNGYRDTLNYTATGGLYDSGSIFTNYQIPNASGFQNLRAPGELTLADLPAGAKIVSYIDFSGDPIQPYKGQLDIFGDWSMANDGGLGEIEARGFLTFLGTAGATSATFTDSNGVVHSWGGTGNHNREAGTGESMDLFALAAGDYTIIAAGEGFSGGGSMYLVTSPVPVPGAVWLFGSALAGLIGVKKRKVR